MVPLGFCSVTSLSVMYFGHWRRHISGSEEAPSRGARWGDGNQTPPAPFPDASWCPLADESKGTSSAIRVLLREVVDQPPRKRKPSGFAALPQGESNFVGFPRCTKKNCSNTSSASSIEGDDSRPRLVRRRGWRNPGRRDEDEENSGQRTMYVMFPTSGPRRLTTAPKPHDGGAGDRMGL